MTKQHPYYPLLISDDGKVTLLNGTELKPHMDKSCPNAALVRIPMSIAKRINQKTNRPEIIMCYIKRLVAECFMEVPDYQYAVVNIDGNLLNNRVDNLRIIPMRDITGTNVKRAAGVRRTPVMIDGIKYASATIAAKELAPKLHYSEHTISGFLSRIKYHKEKPSDTKFKIEHNVVLYENQKE